jgi:hypothetical protein
LSVDLFNLDRLDASELLAEVEAVIGRMAVGRATARDGLVVGEMARRVRAINQMDEIEIEREVDGRREILKGFVHPPVGAECANQHHAKSSLPDLCRICKGTGMVDCGPLGSVDCQECHARGDV